MSKEQTQSMDACASLREDYLFGWMEVEEEAAFEQHLLGCETCRSKIAEHRFLSSVVAPPQEAPETISVTEHLALLERVWSRHQVTPLYDEKKSIDCQEKSLTSKEALSAKVAKTSIYSLPSSHQGGYKEPLMFWEGLFRWFGERGRLSWWALTSVGAVAFLLFLQAQDVFHLAELRFVQKKVKHVPPSRGREVRKPFQSPMKRVASQDNPTLLAQRKAPQAAKKRSVERKAPHDSLMIFSEASSLAISVEKQDALKKSQEGPEYAMSFAEEKIHPSAEMELIEEDDPSAFLALGGEAQPKARDVLPQKKSQEVAHQEQQQGSFHVSLLGDASVTNEEHLAYSSLSAQLSKPQSLQDATVLATRFRSRTTVDGAFVLERHHKAAPRRAKRDDSLPL